MKKYKEIIGLEVIKVNIDEEVYGSLTEKEIKDLYYSNVKEEFIKVDDLSQPYIIRLVTSDTQQLKSLEPELLPNGDDFEMAETIQGLLKERDVRIFKSDFDKEILKEAKENKSKISDIMEKAESSATESTDKKSEISLQEKAKRELREVHEQVAKNMSEGFKQLLQKVKEEKITLTDAAKQVFAQNNSDQEINENKIKILRNVIEDIEDIKPDGTIIYKSDKIKEDVIEADYEAD